MTTLINMPQPVAAIISVVGEVFGVAELDLVSIRRPAEFCRARFAIIGLALEMTIKTHVQIARAIGNRDHTTIGYGADRYATLLRSDPEFATQVQISRAALVRLAEADVAGASWQTDARAAAQRIISDPVRGLHAVSSNGIRAMAARLLELEEQLEQMERSDG